MLPGSSETCTRPGTGSRTGSAATSTDAPPEPSGTYLAVDVGGTKLASALVDANGHVAARSTVPTPQTASAEQLYATLVDLIEEVRRAPEADAVLACGVGCGGPMGEGTVSPLNIPAWRDFPLASRLTETLGFPVVVDNDAKALALAEWWHGAARGVRNFLAMVVSTGVGGGLVLDGRLLDGREGNAGHIGHVIVEPDGRRCPCGARGCLEAEASGRAIEAATGSPAALASDQVKARAGTLVGRAVASVSNLLDLDLAVVGGSVALGFGTPFFDAAQRELSARARLAFSQGCRITPVGLGDLAPLIGAGELAIRMAHPTWFDGAAT